MLRLEKGGWTWNGQPLGLVEPEAALLVAMLRARGQARLPHLWLASARNQPTSPASGRAFVTTLRRKLEWAGAPELVQGDLLRGVYLVNDVPVADDSITRRALHADQDDDATTA